MICEKCTTKDKQQRMIEIKCNEPVIWSWGCYNLYGCPECGDVKFEFVEKNHPDSPCQMIQDEYDITKFCVSN